MATKKQKDESGADRVEVLEQVLIDTWNEAQGCDGSRGGQQDALDSIQSIIEEEMPDVAEYEATETGDNDD